MELFTFVRSLIPLIYVESGTDVLETGLEKHGILIDPRASSLPGPCCSQARHLF